MFRLCFVFASIETCIALARSYLRLDLSDNYRFNDQLKCCHTPSGETWHHELITLYIQSISEPWMIIWLRLCVIIRPREWHDPGQGSCSPRPGAAQARGSGQCDKCDLTLSLSGSSPGCQNTRGPVYFLVASGRMKELKVVNHRFIQTVKQYRIFQSLCQYCPWREWLWILVLTMSLIILQVTC